jgi:glycosyltransferase involved in cell wall biosynthesis
LTAKSPSVTVVIPTRARPRLLERAIRSVLRQTLQDFELVVVLDGREAQDATLTADVVASFHDPRIRLLTLAEPAGGAAARNAGVDAARGEWIAFLDDDDEFDEDKLELQQNAALDSGDPDRVLLTSQVRVVGGTTEPVWPHRFPEPDELLVDYLFCRHGLRQGEAFLQSSTFFVSRKLALHAPFRPDLARHQDWDWVIALQVHHGVQIVGLPRALTLYHRGDGPSVSRMSGWRNSLAWGREIVLPQSRTAYSFFIATQCVTRLHAAECRRWSVLREFAQESFAVGRADWRSTLFFAAFWTRACLRSV